MNPLEKAEVSGIASGATMEGLDLALGTEEEWPPIEYVEDLADGEVEVKMDGLGRHFRIQKLTEVQQDSCAGCNDGDAKYLIQCRYHDLHPNDFADLIYCTDCLTDNVVETDAFMCGDCEDEFASERTHEAEDWYGLKNTDRFVVDDWEGWIYEDNDGTLIYIDGPNGSISKGKGKDITLHEAKAYLNRKGIPYGRVYRSGDWDSVQFTHPKEECYKHDWSKDYYIEDARYEGDDGTGGVVFGQGCNYVLCNAVREGHVGGKVYWDMAAEEEPPEKDDPLESWMEDYDAEEPSAYDFVKEEMLKASPMNESEVNHFLDKLSNVPMSYLKEARSEAIKLQDESAKVILTMAINRRSFREEWASEDDYVEMMECPHCSEFGDGEIPTGVDVDRGDRWSPPTADITGWEMCEYCEGKGEVEDTPENQNIPTWDWDYLLPDEPDYDRYEDRYDDWDAEAPSEKAMKHHLREQVSCDDCGKTLNERHYFYHFPEAVQKSLGMKTPYICSYSDDPMCLIDGFIGNVPYIDREEFQAESPSEKAMKDHLREQIACAFCDTNLKDSEYWFYHFPEVVQKELGMKTPYVCPFSANSDCMLDFVGNVSGIHYDSFDAESWKGHCERCGEATNTTTMSWFNTDIICMDCADEEKNHPKYQEAKDKELAEVRKGNLNYEGIGFDAETNGDKQLELAVKRTKMSMIRTGLAITTFGIVLWNLWTNKKQEKQISDIMGLV